MEQLISAVERLSRQSANSALILDFLVEKLRSLDETLRYRQDDILAAIRETKLGLVRREPTGAHRIVREPTGSHRILGDEDYMQPHIPEDDSGGNRVILPDGTAIETRFPRVPEKKEGVAGFIQAFDKLSVATKVIITCLLLILLGFGGRELLLKLIGLWD